MKRIKRKQKFLKHLDLDLFSLFTPYKHLFLNKCLLIFSLLVCFYQNE